MNSESFQSGYVSRGEEEGSILAAAAAVRQSGQSRALLLYGLGGVGKTSLIRNLARARQDDPDFRWLTPIDVDDPEFWLLATLERGVVSQLDPDGDYFGPYLKYLSRLPSYTGPRLGRETVVSHLGRIKRVFVECYAKYVDETGATVVMTFDTVEAMRGIYLLYTLTQWMKSLPGTLFILSGRPMVQPGDRPDPIRDELEDEHQHIPVSTLALGRFSHATAREYLSRSEIGGHLSPTEKDKLVLLTRGHPLWLAFAVSYIREWDLPAEMEPGLEHIRQVLPYEAELSRDGHRLAEDFKRRLVTPYHEDDFWHEAIKRLSVVRQGMSQPIWERLMRDRQLPDEAATSDSAWQMLRETPWVRTRAQGRYVTLHDAVAEELAQRIIPLHDSDHSWRRQLWQRAAGIYRELSEESMTELAADQARVDGVFRRRAAEVGQGTGAFLVPYPGQVAEDAGHDTAGHDTAGDDTAGDDAGHAELIAEVVRLEARARELDQLRVTAFHYGLLSDFSAGTSQFIALFGQAKRDYNVFLQDRLALEMQRFLPDSEYPYPLDDVISFVLRDFADWLTGEAGERYLEIGMVVGGYLIDNEHPKTAIALLDRLPAEIADSAQRARLEILKANACMRIPERMWDGLICLDHALGAAHSVPGAGDRQAAIADVFKERGFFFRNAGRWQQADESYRQARNAILENYATRKSDSDHADMASIQTNWAYLMGLRGDYGNASTLVDRAIGVRRRLDLHLQEGISRSVQGEIFRYERKFAKAWESFAAAEQVFQGRRDWSWLGQIYQEQAICLVQALADDVALVPGKDSADQAKRLITRALDICRDQNLRAYPSALNRAGRIFGADSVEAGLDYLAEAIEWSRRLSDGWFGSASLLEYVELSYRAWAKTGRPDARAVAADKADAIHQALLSYDYSDLRGRWLIVNGHLALHDYLDTRQHSRLDVALREYREGFRLLAQGQFGSSGASAIGPRFEQFGALFVRLASNDQRRCLGELSSSWRTLGDDSITLFAFLEQLY